MTAHAEVVVACPDVQATQAFFVERLGFRTDAVFPADDPREVVVSGRGVRLLLRRGDDEPGTLRLHVAEGHGLAADIVVGDLVAPNGMRIELVDAAPALVVPPRAREVVVTRAADSGWHPGRAGMEYRDLIPSRLGGHVIASHIRIAQGGPVGDLVHFHRVGWQVIHCLRSAVQLVYEDQGEPFWLRAGELVLQPPGIRHRVLACEPSLEVVEVSCPAEHETLMDHEMQLPTAAVDRSRRFAGQPFVHARDLRVAVDGQELLAEVRRGALAGDAWVFGYVRAGSVRLVVGDGDLGRLATGDAFTVPSGVARELVDASEDCEWFAVVLS